MTIEAAIVLFWVLLFATACVAPYIRDAWNTFQLGRATIRLYDGEDDPRASAWKVTRIAQELEHLKRTRVKANPPRLPHNVVRLNSRAARPGKPMHFEGPGAA